jgi:hypothetical protein
VRKIYLQKEFIGGSLNLFYGGLGATAPAEREKSTPNIPMPKQTHLSVFCFKFYFFYGT